MGLPIVIQNIYGAGFKRFKVTPFLRDLGLLNPTSTSKGLNLKLSYAKYTRYNPPRIKIMPKIDLYPSRNDIIIKDNDNNGYI